MKKYTNLLLCACALGATISVQAQEKKPTTMLGIYFGPNLNFHSADFAIPQNGGSDRPSGVIDNATLGLGWSAGALVEHRLNNWIGLGLRLGINGAGGTELTGNDTSRSILVQKPGDESSVTSATLTKRTLTPTVNYLDIAPNVFFPDVFDVENLYGTIGLGIGIPLSPKHTHTIDLVDPTPSEYIMRPFNGSTSFTSPSEEIPDAALRLAIDLGIGYNFQLSDKIWLAPEAKFSMPLTKVSSNTGWDSWTVPQLRLSAALKFDISGSDDDKPAPAESAGELNANMGDVVYYDETGNASSLKVLKVEDLQYSEMYPLVPYVFFDKGSTSMQSQVTISREAGEFSVETLPQDAIEINNNTLNIIAVRMQKYPQASLTIIGTNSGGKGESKALAQQRAEAAKQRLVALGIDASRIAVEARDLPEKPSNNTIPEGMDENRRVEFRSNTPEVLDPIVIQKEKQRITTPNMVEFRPTASGAPVKSWNLTVTQAGNTLREFSRTGEPSPQRWVIRPNELSASQLPIEYTYTVTGSDGASKEVNGTIPVDYISSTRKSVEQLPDRVVEKFSLILFDFDKSDITTDNSRILEKVVVPAVKFNSVVKIYGYTDRIGDPDYNKKLSKQRAEAVKSYLEGKVKAARYEVAGVGEDLILFDNDMPVGRQLCRTVQVFIETPTK